MFEFFCVLGAMVLTGFLVAAACCIVMTGIYLVDKFYSFLFEKEE